MDGVPDSGGQRPPVTVPADHGQPGPAGSIGQHARRVPALRVEPHRNVGKELSNTLELGGHVMDGLPGKDVSVAQFGLIVP